MSPTIRYETTYAASLRRRLKRAKISQRELARAMGVKSTHISRWMTGRAQPTLHSVERIEAALAVLREGR